MRELSNDEAREIAAYLARVMPRSNEEATRIEAYVVRLSGGHGRGR